MYCKKCGYPLQPGQTSCFNCWKEEYKEPEKKKIPKWLIILIIMVFIIPLVGYLLIFAISASSVKSTISRASYTAFWDQYRDLYKQVSVYYLGERECSCDNNCDSIYNYNAENINFKVEDKGSYYELTFSAKENGSYEDIDILEEDCIKKKNTTCENNVIKGKVYKQ